MAVAIDSPALPTVGEQARTSTITLPRTVISRSHCCPAVCEVVGKIITVITPAVTAGTPTSTSVLPLYSNLMWLDLHAFQSVTCLS